MADARELLRRAGLPGPDEKVMATLERLAEATGKPLHALAGELADSVSAYIDPAPRYLGKGQKRARQKVRGWR